MTQSTFHAESNVRRPDGVRLLAVGIATALLFADLAAGRLPAQAPAKGGSRIAGKMVTPFASLLRRAAGGKGWQGIHEKDDVPAEEMVIGIGRALIVSSNGSVGLELRGSPLDDTPIREAAVVIHDNPKVDLDFTLDRGRVHIINRKSSGEARVLIRLSKDRDPWELDLEQPGTEVAVQRFGRYTRGLRSKEDRLVPTQDVTLVVLKGELLAKQGAVQHRMHAPPGPAWFHGDSESGPDPGPRRLEKIPDWARDDAEVRPEVKQIRAVLQRMRQRAMQTSIETTLAEALKTPDPTYHRMAVQVLGATDQVSALIDALVNPAYQQDVREDAIVTLRHWHGRGPEQDEKLLKLLVEEKKYQPVHAKMVVQLLNRFDETVLGQPEVYELLIAALLHPNPAVRELVRWHLYRLVPQGRDIPYNSTDPEEKRQQAFEKWKVLIPEGQLPPKPKSGGK